MFQTDRADTLCHHRSIPLGPGDLHCSKATTKATFAQFFSRRWILGEIFLVTSTTTGAYWMSINHDKPMLSIHRMFFYQIAKWSLIAGTHTGAYHDTIRNHMEPLNFASYLKTPIGLIEHHHIHPKVFHSPRDHCISAWVLIPRCRRSDRQPSENRPARPSKNFGVEKWGRRAPFSAEDVEIFDVDCVCKELCIQAFWYTNMVVGLGKEQRQPQICNDVQRYAKVQALKA